MRAAGIRGVLTIPKNFEKEMRLGPRDRSSGTLLGVMRDRTKAVIGTIPLRRTR